MLIDNMKEMEYQLGYLRGNYIFRWVLLSREIARAGEIEERLNYYSSNHSLIELSLKFDNATNSMHKMDYLEGNI